MSLGKVTKVDFFRRWTPEMAWVVGFIAADGSVSRRGPHSLSVVAYSTDRDVIDKIAGLVGGLEVQKLTRNTGKAYYKTVWFVKSYRYEFVEPLLQIGVIPKKSKFMGPLDVPEEFFWHFLRGFTDGDGCVRGRGSYSNVRWSGGSLPFLVWLRDSVCRMEDLVKVAISKQSRREAWEFGFGGSSAVRVLNRMYDGALVYMDRKYREAHEILSGSVVL